ncbi:GNAT family N-acetyltransferase, partial [Streptomyces sp. WAC 01420]
MPLTYTFDPAVDPALRDGILDLWTDVSNAGGAVGYVPPVTREEIRPGLVKQFASMAEGRSRLVVGHDDEGRVAATAFLTLNTHPL